MQIRPLHMELTLIILVAATLAALIAWLLTHFISRARYDRQLYAKDAQLAAKDAELRSAQALRAHESELYARTLAELNASQQQALEATKNELALENERQLKAREESLRREAEATMRALTGGLDKDIKEMKDAFDAQKKAHAEESSSIKTQFEQTVRHLKEQTDAIGTQAGDLANALKGQNKMQGIFGETILENLLQAEGLRPGRDYETEFWLRDKAGNIIHNDLTEKKMRPDFALHYPDSTDVILDAKVSLTALSDYFSADSDAARADAARRNLQSVLSHVQELAGKPCERVVILPCEHEIDAEFDIARLRVHDVDRHVDLAPGDALFKDALDGFLGELITPGHLDGYIAVAMVHRPYLDRDAALRVAVYSAPEACHAFDHIYLSS